MVYEKLGEQVFGTPGKMIVFGSTSLQNTGGKGDVGYWKPKPENILMLQLPTTQVLPYLSDILGSSYSST